MPEAKNNFLKGRMNKDVDERLIQDGEYRNANNLAISSSDSGSSGSLENVLGTTELSNFGLSDRNLECIGHYADVEGGRVFMFLTNYTDSSSDTLSNFAATNSAHYIVSYNIISGQFNILVKGNFLNFSKTHKIIQVNLIEDLLFWTDDRNQPRKINVETAIAQSNLIDLEPYYSNEDSISVAKYYPWSPIRLYKIPESGEPNYGRINDYNHSLLDNITTIYTTTVLGVSTTYTFDDLAGGNPQLSTSGSGSGAVFTVTSDSGGNVGDVIVVDGGVDFETGDTITLPDPTGGGGDSMVITLTEQDMWVQPTMKDTTSLDLPYTITATFNNTVSSATHSITRNESTEDPTKFVGCVFYVTDSNGQVIVPIDTSNTINTINLSAGDVFNINIDSAITVTSGDTLHIGANPHYNEDDIATISNIRDKFVRFAYRFKYDDNEYSLISPFTQSIFIPKQDGHFTGTPSEIDKDEIDTVKSTSVDFFENKVTEVELIIDLPEGFTSVSQLSEDLKVKEVDIIYKDASEPSLKVVRTIKQDEIINNTNTYLSYTYKSSEPTKVLPERELTRVSDKIPVRAKAQESIGNRVVYGNFLRSFSGIKDLDYSVEYGDKGLQWEYSDAYSRKEYPSHTLKQNRTYQVGIVLCDRFGRKSDVITSDNSTVFSKYKDGDFNLITSEDLDSSTGLYNSFDDVYLGDALRVIFNTEFPEDTTDPLYAGLYDADTNPLGWYSYQVVVKQKKQSYYNAYVPTILNGYPKSATNRDGTTAHITLTGDNINKIPRDFTLSNEGDDVFRSSIQIFPRVINNEQTANHDSELFTGGEFPNKVSIIGTRNEMGLDTDETGTGYAESPFYSIPSSDSADLGSNPLIARVSTRTDIGSEGGNSSITNSVAYNDYSLNVVETRPFESNLEIFWETSTSGLISEINTKALAPENSDGIPFRVTGYNFTQNESTGNGDDCSTVFNVTDFSGNVIDSSSPNVTASIVSIRSKNGQFKGGTRFMNISKSGTGFKLVGSTFIQTAYYNRDSYINENYDIVINVTNLVDGVVVNRNIKLPESRLQNSEPTFNNPSISDIDNTFTIDTSSSPFGAPVNEGWREVSDIVITNGSLAGSSTTQYSLLQLDYVIDRVEWYNTDASQYYDYWYWYKGFTDDRFRDPISIATRNPNGLIKFVFYNTGTSGYVAKMYRSPVLQWFHSDLPIVTGGGFIDSNYSGESPSLPRNFISPIYAGGNTSGGYEINGSPSTAGSSTTLYRSGIYTFSDNKDSLRPSLESNGGATPSNGLADNLYFSGGEKEALCFGFTDNDGGIFTGTQDLQIRVTFTLFDADRTGISKQFTSTFNIDKSNYPTISPA